MPVTRQRFVAPPANTPQPASGNEPGRYMRLSLRSRLSGEDLPILGAARPVQLAVNQ
jgi:hypothetical protein